MRSRVGRAPLTDKGPVIEARKIAVALGGRWFGHYGVAPCPICQPERRSDQTALTISDGERGTLYHCKKLGCDFRSILAAVIGLPAIATHPDIFASPRRNSPRLVVKEQKEASALGLWKDSVPIRHTIAEAYLRSRGITCSLPDTLRYHPECWHSPSRQRWPAMVARVDGAQQFAVHRTFLTDGGAGKVSITPNKMMLGGTAGGAVRLAKASMRLVVAEGIESALSLMCGFLDGPASVWAALSTSGMRALDLPVGPGRLTLARDGDAPGRSAALALAERAHALGWQVGFLDPGDNLDFNDLLTGKAVATCR